MIPRYRRLLQWYQSQQHDSDSRGRKRYSRRDLSRTRMPHMLGGVTMPDFLPSSEENLVSWFQKFVAGLKEYRTTLGLSDGDIRPVENDSNVLTHLVGATDAARASATGPDLMNEMVGYKDLIKNGPGETLRN